MFSDEGVDLVRVKQDLVAFITMKVKKTKLQVKFLVQVSLISVLTTLYAQIAIVSQEK